MSNSVITAEHYPNMTSAVFGDGEQAQQVVTALEHETRLQPDQIDLIEPNDPQAPRKLETESQGIFRTILRTHTSLGLIGIVAGLVLASILYFAGVVFARSSPFWTYTLFGAFGGVFGLLAAGVVSVRPDHQPAILQADAATKQGRWTVIVHARDQRQKSRAEQILRQHSDHVHKSL